MWEEAETREAEPTIFYHNGMRVGSIPRINRVNLSELHKKAKEMGVKGLDKMRKAELWSLLESHHE